jgi:hypothetical protein
VLTLRERLVAAGIVAAIALLLYSSTLLPGQDLGDTAAFQAIAGRQVITPRDGYPLYYRVLDTFLRLVPGEPARATNLASAVAASLAVGLVVLAGAELAGSLVAGLVAALLLAGSYTFWSQAIIAEVYALHLLIATASLLALLAWHRRPSLGRLAVFFAVYALGFGNHLSMVLLLPGFGLFLLLAAPGGPLQMLRPRVVFLALGLAALFALQYGWNAAGMLALPDHGGVGVMARNFWFDVTKSDWRAVMVYGTPHSMIDERFGMYWFDLRQQFGVPGIAAAVAGLVFLFVRSWRLGVLLGVLWTVNWAFAFTYNVGDVHVFFLPSHWAVALAAGCGAAWVASLATARLRDARARAVTVVVAAALLAYPAWRVYDTYPAVDRSRDWEPKAFFDRLTGGMDGDREVLGTDLNWQLHNGFDYYAWNTRRDLAVFDATETLLYFPFLVQDNARMGRQIVLTEGSAAMVRDLYGPLYTLQRDPRLAVPSLADRIALLPAGTPYVLAWIEPYSEAPLSPADVSSALARLGLSAGDLPKGRYAALVGRVGQPPVARAGSDRPFRLRTTALGGRAIEVRIECWVPFDTIRRAGFGHVIVDRQHDLTLDRGVSFVALDDGGRAPVRAWLGGLYTPQPRFLVKPGA